MEVLLAAVQARIEPEAYRTPEAFAARTLEQINNQIRQLQNQATAMVRVFRTISLV
jgi:conjugal transfer/entry exclusion protein